MKPVLTLLTTALALVPLYACTSEPSAAESEQDVSLGSFSDVMLKEHVGKHCYVEVSYLQLEENGMHATQKAAINKALRPSARTLLGTADCDVADSGVSVPNISIFGSYGVDAYRDGILSVSANLEERRATGKTYHTVSQVFETSTGKNLRFNSVLDTVGVTAVVEACKKKLAPVMLSGKCSDTTNFGIYADSQGRSLLMLGHRDLPATALDVQWVRVNWADIGTSHITHPALKVLAERHASVSGF